MSIARGTLFNLAGAAVPILVSLATVPLYLDLIGAERFGILVLFWLILGQSGAFDLGLGRALTQRIASLKSGTAEQRSDAFWAALWMSLALSVAMILILAPLASSLLGAMSISDPALAREMEDALVWLVLSIPAALLVSVLTGPLVGRERFGILNLVEALSFTLLTVLPLAAGAWFAPTLMILLSTSLLARATSALLLFLTCAKAMPLRRPTRPKPETIRSLLIFGGWVTLGSMVGPLLAYSDRFAISAWIGPAAVSVYVIPFTLALRILVVPTALSRALFPRFAAVEPAKAASLYRSSLRALAAVMTPIIACGILFARPFLDLWVGAEIGRQAAPVAYVLLAGMWFSGLAVLPFTELQARGKARLIAGTYMAELVPFALTLVAFIHFWGIVGAALASALRMAADTVILFALSAGGLRPLTFLVPSGGLIVATTAAALMIPDDSSWRWPALSVLVLGCCLEAYRQRPPEFAAAFKRAAPGALGPHQDELS